MKVIIFDNENEYKTLLKEIDPENVYIFDPWTDRDNHLEPPPECQPKEWLAKLKKPFREFYLRDGSINLLDKLHYNLYANNGIFDGGDDYPTILDLISLLDKIQFKPGTRFSGYHESLSNRFNGLLDNLGDTLTCKKGYNLFKKQGKVIIYRTGSLSDEVRNFYINLKILKESTYREKFPPHGIETIYIIDETHKHYNEKLALRNDLSEPLIFSSSRTLRKLGIGCIYSDQVPSELPSSLSGNVNNHFVFRLVNGKCIWRISQAMSLNKQQAECLPTLPKRQCIFQSGDYPNPVLVEIPELSFDQVSEEEVEQHMKQILPNLKYAPVTEDVETISYDSGQDIPFSKSSRTHAKPNNMWKEILRLIINKSPVSLTEIYQNLGNINPWQGRRIISDMEKQQMIESCSVSFGARGNPKTFVILKQKGAEFIGVDFDKVKLPGKGSTEHVILQNLLARSMKDSGKAISIEHSVNGKSVDIAEIGENRSVAYEIELAPSHTHVIENIQKDLEAGFDEVIVVTRNKACQDEAKNQVYKNIEWEKLSKVKFRLLRELL